MEFSNYNYKRLKQSKRPPIAPESAPTPEQIQWKEKLKQSIVSIHSFLVTKMQTETSKITPFTQQSVGGGNGQLFTFTLPGAEKPLFTITFTMTESNEDLSFKQIETMDVALNSTPAQIYSLHLDNNKLTRAVDVMSINKLLQNNGFPESYLLPLE
jgi:hypothetical protein